MMLDLAASLLVPRDVPVPDGFASVSLPLDRGLPAMFVLDSTLAIVLTFPTGQIRQWQRMDLTAIVSDSADEVAPLRLTLVAAGRPVASQPLVRGRRLLLPATGSAIMELIATDWRVFAGDLVGPGSRGGFLALAWRPLGAGTKHFAAPIARPDVLVRLDRHALDGSMPTVSPKPGGLDWERRHGPR